MKKAIFCAFFLQIFYKKKVIFFVLRAKVKKIKKLEKSAFFFTFPIRLGRGGGYRILPLPPTCGFGLKFQPAVLSESVRSAEIVLLFFGYQAAIPTCGAVQGFGEIRRLVRGSILYGQFTPTSKSKKLIRFII